MKKVSLAAGNRSKLAVLLITVGLILAVVALVVTIHQHKTEPKLPSGALTSGSTPSSAKLSPQTVASYSVPPTDPKYVAIPGIKVGKTPLVPLGLTSGRAIAVPDNIYKAGWYTGSSKPGQNGAMFIYGHVSSWTATGIFYNLKKLRPGDKISVTRGDNKVYIYQVASSKVYPYNHVDMGQVLSPVNSSAPGLNVMTCTGQIIKGTSEFSDRLVVFASLVSS